MTEYEYLQANKTALLRLAPMTPWDEIMAPSILPKPAPTEAVQRAAYSIHGACADILRAIQEVTDFNAAEDIARNAEDALRALDAVVSQARAKVEQLSKEKN